MHYSVSSESGLEYFKVHKSADVEHAAAEKQVLRKLAKDEETRKKVLQAVDKALDAY